ncbi:MAG TPA: aminotransferase class V-fold PLP-dependent enzyme [Leptolyngbyaceae cyanobacterium M33_DOE_097]|uniref:Aminotransferase class V-fold PLP-dependent enzyme n=1 Tax=Oscillatoriales cyanobacterium SpSt-418 TaxID=2282169 RepID=A0A7C3KD69_9CYAN|nr:aminotransferase class V-fold PLP-dependent enzyme [Leptolyngbyaceae cyanobacterium M33_DOE_097]
MATLQKPTDRSQFAEYWSLDPEIVFLNHGSFGACPLPVLEHQQEWRSRLERQPLRFFGKEFEPALDNARTKLADFVGADPADLVFVPNATTGVNAVLRSLRFAPGDELLTTNQEYNACRNALNFVAERWGATIVVADIPFPIESPEQVVRAVLEEVTPQTRLVLIDHIVSQTALVLPIAEILQLLNAIGIETLVDGAHAPGMLPLNLQELGATYYTGNCHKWLSAPKGAAFLYVQRDRHAQVRPLTISHGANDPRSERSRFHLEFDWMGTDDPSAYLSVPAAIDFMCSLLPGGWPELMARNRALAIAAQRLLCGIQGSSSPCPESMLGAMASIPLPDGSPKDLYDALTGIYQIEVPIVPFPAASNRLVRISAQIYNTKSQYQYLADCLKQLLEK